MISGDTTSQWRSLAVAYAGTDLPPDYILTLIDFESGGNASIINPSSNATGLMQITSVALADYNQRRNTGFAMVDMLDPEMNIAVGTDLLRRIIASYKTNHPQSLSPDWRSPRWVALLTLGWNAGYSERAGVGFVVQRLESAGITPDRITVDSVSQLTSQLEGATRNLAMPDRVNWAKRVAAAFAETPAGRPVVSSNGNGGGGSGGSAWPWIIGGAAVAGGIGYLIYQRSKEQEAAEARAMRKLEREEAAQRARSGIGGMATGFPSFVVMPTTHHA